MLIDRIKPNLIMLLQISFFQIFFERTEHRPVFHIVSVDNDVCIPIHKIIAVVHEQRAVFILFLCKAMRQIKLAVLLCIRLEHRIVDHRAVDLQPADQIRILRIDLFVFRKDLQLLCLHLILCLSLFLSRSLLLCRRIFLRLLGKIFFLNIMSGHILHILQTFHFLRRLLIQIILIGKIAKARNRRTDTYHACYTVFARPFGIFLL